MATNSVSFFCYENDKPVEIQLEPEALIFIANPECEIKFVATCDTQFDWTLRIQGDGIQLFPNSKGDYSIEIFENDVLLEDWWKYM